MPQLFTNNAKGRLQSAITDAQTTITLQTGQGALFPAPTGSDFFLATLFQYGTDGEINHEIVRCTARSGDVFTVTRAQEGTSARAFDAANPIELRITRDTINTLNNSSVTTSTLAATFASVGGVAVTTASGIHWGDTIYPVTIIGNALTGNCYLSFNTNTFGNSAAERMRIGPAGQIGIGGANYGTAGQVFTSNGPDAAPSWSNGGSRNWVAKTSAYTAVAGDAIFADTASGTWNLTLPASPAVGDTIVVVDVAGAFATNNLTIRRNGLKIMGLSEDMTVSTNNSAFELVYSGATYGWRVL